MQKLMFATQFMTPHSFIGYYPSIVISAVSSRVGSRLVLAP